MTKGTNTGGRSGRRGKVVAVSASQEAARARVLRELNVPRGVWQALGTRSAAEILEAWSCAKSVTR